MKLTNFAIVNMINTLDKFTGKKLPQKISYAITRNLILLQKDYECYIKSLNNLFSDYDECMVRDDCGNIAMNDTGIPIVDSKVAKEFNKEISDLLNIEVDIEIHHIPENMFDYEDNANRYDPLSSTDIISLQSVLCTKVGGDGK